ncbi:hypothetical protein [Chondromyces apiculatus]|uniref:Transporter n=1 Tax=Chondromyces apiculatus DSM 436 TaxID=1192034 RepID=A0A017TBJ0_9BACT|nr:hypothetical protein [Chondromyces apiculatus]EYF06648.1 Hypothetical protein CAP_1778 [Chondromyces apiculatus DSM 436]
MRLCRPLCLAGALTVFFAGPSASAQGSPPLGAIAEEQAVFDPPAPPTLPGLTRRDLTFTFETTVSVIEPEPPSTGGSAYGWSAHGELELPLVPRRWFIGAAHEIASAALPGVGSKTLLGSPEIWGRGVWSSVRGLASGGGFGVVLPAPRNLTGAEQDVLQAARTVRPWDAAYFADMTLVARPWFDIRLVTGPFIFQLRQGLDWSLVVRELMPEEPRYDLTARATFYFGYRATEAIGLGLELWEVYQLTADPRVNDGERAAFAISPSIRFMFPYVQPALSMLFPLATPLRGEVETYYAARLNVGFTFPTGRRSDPAPGL